MFKAMQSTNGLPRIKFVQEAFQTPFPSVSLWDGQKNLTSACEDLEFARFCATDKEHETESRITGNAEREVSQIQRYI